MFERGLYRLAHANPTPIPHGAHTGYVWAGLGNLCPLWPMLIPHRSRTGLKRDQNGLKWAHMLQNAEHTWIMSTTHEHHLGKQEVVVLHVCKQEVVVLHV